MVKATMLGQAEIIAALLLTVIVLAGFAITWTYLFPSYLSWEHEASNTALESRLAASEKIVIGNAVFSSSTVKLTLVNTGSVGIRVRAIYVNETPAWQGQLDLAPGQPAEISLSVPGDNLLLWVKVCSARGNCWIFPVFNSSLTTPTTPPPPPPPPPPSGGAPVFVITSYNSTIYGQPGSTASLVVGVSNTENSSGACRVEVYDQAGSLAASTTTTIQAGSTVTVRLALTLPGTKGTYTWTIKAYNSYTGRYDDSKTFTVRALDILPDTSAVLFYTPFETPPSGWQAMGGKWRIATGQGWAGSNALQGVDDNKGPSRTSIYSWSQAIGGYSHIRTLVVLGGVNQNDGIDRGFAFLDISQTTRGFYGVVIQPSKGNVILKVELGTTSGISDLNQVSAGYSSSWYILYCGYSRSGGVNSFSATLYDQSGVGLATLQVSDSSLSPNYFGLLVDGGTAFFDDLVLATGDPRYVNVTGLDPGWSVEIWRGSTLVASGVADATGVARLDVKLYPIVQPATLVVKDGSGAIVLSRTYDVVVGGYVFRVDP
ncbi:hypothetical protein MA03_03830 [Infirmifilum uzonense]|uniref:Uncharacterized protein n=1 Tax=Infirmifilum uzonense TaxID=1550241 RepID=A0A0F7FH89_9CREN|nr:hypothetical protein [Infirmifilum uzonense]AKG38589.1 hypothetical protein MA03_03830 [Infirmifilum uzonense]